MSLKTLLKRSWGGILFLAVVLGSFLSAYTFLVLSVLLAVGLSFEFYRMMLGRRFGRERLSVICAVSATVVLTWCHFQFGLDTRFIALGLLPAVAASVFLLFDCSENHEFPAAVFFPLVYVLPALLSAQLLVFPSGGLFTWRLLLGIMVTLWMNDIGAYLVGMGFGQREGSRKLFPSLSPKKSWIGAVGGTLFTFLSAWIVSVTFGSAVLPLMHWMATALIVSVFGVFGDLFESLIKRHARVKDAGNIIPGHGGLLDRFDDVLFVLPLLAAYFLIFSLI